MSSRKSMSRIPLRSRSMGRRFRKHWRLSMASISFAAARPPPSRAMPQSASWSLLSTAWRKRRPGRIRQPTRRLSRFGIAPRRAAYLSPKALRPSDGGLSYSNLKLSRLDAEGPRLCRSSFWGKREHGDGGVPAADFGDSFFVDDPAVPRNDGNVLHAMRRIRNDAPLHRVG